MLANSTFLLLIAGIVLALTSVLEFATANLSFPKANYAWDLPSARILRRQEKTILRGAARLCAAGAALCMILYVALTV